MLYNFDGVSFQTSRRGKPKSNQINKYLQIHSLWISYIHFSSDSDQPCPFNDKD